MSYGLKASLRGQNATPELQRLLPQSELEMASTTPHLPNLVAMVSFPESPSLAPSACFLQGCCPCPFFTNAIIPSEL